MTELKFKPKREQKPSSLTLTPQLRDLYKIVNDKKASHSERKQALDEINKLAEPEPEYSVEDSREWKIPKKCEFCGSEFTPKRRKQITCGKPECKNERNNKNKKRGYAETFEKGKVWRLDEKTWKWKREDRNG